MKDTKIIDYLPVSSPEQKESSSNNSGDDNHDKSTTENCDNATLMVEACNFEDEGGIDYDAVGDLVGDIKELRKGLLVLLLLLIIISASFAMDDYYTNKREIADNEKMQKELLLEDLNKPPYPHMGHKLQINASAFTVNDFECLQLDTGNWPSERVHCELRPSVGDENSINDGDDAAQYDFVVEHFDDKNCQVPNAENPIVRHTASGCYYFDAYDHSYNDVCHRNRTLTVSAFYGQGCLTPMPVTAVNILPEDGK